MVDTRSVYVHPFDSAPEDLLEIGRIEGIGQQDVGSQIPGHRILNVEFHDLEVAVCLADGFEEFALQM